MRPRRFFFLSVAAGLLLTAGGYFGLFHLQLGVPTPQWAWLHGIIEKKRAAANSLTTPKLLIVAGSSALYGISAGEIQRVTGFPAVNFAANAALGPAYTLHLARQVCRPGDVVLLAFEYEPYTFGHLTGATADELFIDYILAHDVDYVRSLAPRAWLRLALLTPRKRLWAGLLAVFQRPGPDAKSEAFTREVLKDINDYGDQTSAVPEKRAATSSTRTLLSHILAYGLPPEPAGFQPIREFCQWARANRIRVVATFPNVCHRPEYDLPAAARTPGQLRAFYDSLGVPLLGDVSESILPESDIFDTMYHPMREAALARTRRLLVHLAPHLKPVPAP